MCRDNLHPESISNFEFRMTNFSQLQVSVPHFHSRLRKNYLLHHTTQVFADPTKAAVTHTSL